MTEEQPEQMGLVKGAVAMCDLIDEKKRPLGEQIEITIMDVRMNGDTPQSYRVHCKTERGTDKIIWVQAQFIHEKVVEPTGEPTLEEVEAL